MSINLGSGIAWATIKLERYFYPGLLTCNDGGPGKKLLADLNCCYVYRMRLDWFSSFPSTEARNYSQTNQKSVHCMKYKSDPEDIETNLLH
jgi:hypothetical protein